MTVIIPIVSVWMVFMYHQSNVHRTKQDDTNVVDNDEKDYQTMWLELMKIVQCKSLLLNYIQQHQQQQLLHDKQLTTVQGQLFQMNIATTTTTTSLTEWSRIIGRSNDYDDKFAAVSFWNTQNLFHLLLLRQRQQQHHAQLYYMQQQQEQQHLLSASTTNTPLITDAITTTTTPTITTIHESIPNDTSTNSFFSGRCTILTLLVLTIVVLYMIYVFVSNFLSFYRVVRACYITRQRRRRMAAARAAAVDASNTTSTHHMNSTDEHRDHVIDNVRQRLYIRSRSSINGVYQQDLFHITTVIVGNDDENDETNNNDDDECWTRSDPLGSLSSSLTRSLSSSSVSLSSLSCHRRRCYCCTRIVGQTCPICLCCFDEKEYVTSCHNGCKNYFHKDCLFEWLDRSTDCPCCRKQLIDPTIAHLHSSSYNNNTNNNNNINRNSPGALLLDFSRYLGYYTHSR